MQPVIVVARERGIWFGFCDNIEARPLKLKKARVMAKEMAPLAGRPDIEIAVPIRQIIEVAEEAVPALDYEAP